MNWRAANQHRIAQSAPRQFIHDQWHLLGCADQQRREPDGSGLDFDRFADDGFGRHLFAEIDDRIAVIGQDGLDQVLADVMNITVDSGDYDRPLVTPSTFSR